MVAELRAGFGEVVAQVKDLAERGVVGLRERLQGADLSELKAVNKVVEERERAEAEKEDIAKSFEEIKAMGRSISKGWERER